MTTTPPREVPQAVLDRLESLGMKDEADEIRKQFVVIPTPPTPPALKAVEAAFEAVDKDPALSALPAQGLLTPSREGEIIMLPLPPAVVPAGGRTTLTFYLAHPSKILNLAWVPGFKLEKFTVGTAKTNLKDFGDGSVKVDGKLFCEHRVLVRDIVTLGIVNESTEDRSFSGSMTIQVSHVIEDAAFTCGVGAHTPPAADAAASDAST